MKSRVGLFTQSSLTHFLSLSLSLSLSPVNSEGTVLCTVPAAGECASTAWSFTRTHTHTHTHTHTLHSNDTHLFAAQ